MTEKRTIVLRSAGGTSQRVVAIDKIEVPDLWHLIGIIRTDPTYGDAAADMILECWHLAHDLKRNLSGEAVGRATPAGYA